MLNKKGSFLIDAMMALVLASLMIFLLGNALMMRVKGIGKERVQDDISTIQEAAERLYLNRDVSGTDDSLTLYDPIR